MSRTTHYLAAVILPGLAVLTFAAANLDPQDKAAFAAFALVAALLSIVKIKLPGLNGSFSLSFLPVLYGLKHFEAPEVLAVAALAAAAGSIFAGHSPSAFAKAAFNAANLTLSTAACLAVYALAATAVPFLPALFCLAAAVYFAVNTALVSGIISLTQNKPLAEVAQAWYLWSFVYYLAGAAAMGLALSPEADLKAWLILAPIAYLIYFFWDLRTQAHETARPDSQSAVPARAKGFITAATLTAATLAAVTLAQMEAPESPRFALIAGAALLAALAKVRLPGLSGNVSASFVVILFAASELPLAETLLLAAAATLLQSFWKVARPPQPLQVVFNLANVILSATLAAAAAGAAEAATHSLALAILAATASYYAANTALVAVVLGLIQHKSAAQIWDTCRFWSLPYFSAGTAVAGLMATVNRSAGAPAAIATLAIMCLIFVAYKAHLAQAQTLHLQPTR
jgi:hypothetical protein